MKGSPRKPKGTKKGKKAKGKKKKEKRAKWNTSMRHVLCCLFRFFKWDTRADKNAFEMVFGHLFGSHLMKCCNQSSLRFKTIHTQWAWMRLNKHTVWCQVHLDSSFRVDAQWQSVIQRIESAATYLSLTLVPKAHDTTYENSSSNELSATEYLESVQLSEHSLDVPTTAARMHPMNGSSDTSEIVTEDTVNKHSQADRGAPDDHNTPGTLVNGDGKCCLWCYKEGNLPIADDENSEYDDISGECTPNFPDNAPEDDPFTQFLGDPVNLTQDLNTEFVPEPCNPSDLPPLVYRWSNGDSQGTNTPNLFEAELFKNRPEVYPPSAISTQTFLEHFWNHVTKAKVKTPFISTFTYPLAPVHRALHEQKGAMVSIIDPSKVDHPIFKAHDLVPVTDTATFSWRGYGEYEVWGRVPAEAIICSFPISRLEVIRGLDIRNFLQLDVIRNFPRCNGILYRALASNLSPKKKVSYLLMLKDLGEFLGVPEDYRDLVAKGFFESWAMRDRFMEMCEGQQQVVGDDRPMPRSGGFHFLSDSDSSFVPEPSGSESSLGSTSSEEAPSSTESMEARCPRWDTPSDGFSVDDESSVCSDRHGMHHTVEYQHLQRYRFQPLTPTSMGSFHKKGASAPRSSVKANFEATPTPAQRTVDLERDWPSEEDILMDTPVRSRFFPINGANRDI
ncbi:hypothetical protein N7492_004597 [Penicillium capsulatum]|uniref:DUF7587 domain-containing protein n=1 Tax=Penicillium capsulatum TaxID=69766 RepID=A0A9W9I7W8_9EURO|nr:hypothetical protein N7492_004597 [Penicillium capsulatum]KAJ6136286.1 hypothetical protein N7512_001446 [Penicillium capsulatum]